MEQLTGLVLSPDEKKLVIDKYKKEYKKTSIENFINECKECILQNRNRSRTFTEISSILGASDIKRFTFLLQPSSKYKKTFIQLDTTYKMNDGDGLLDESGMYYKMKFAVVESLNKRIGDVNTIAPIRNVIAMRLFDMTINTYGSLGPTLPNGTGYMRASILMEEFAGQAYILSDTRRAHWIMQYDQNNIRLDFLYTARYFNDGMCYFNKPITHLDTITITIGNPIYLSYFHYKMKLIFPIEITYIED